MELLHDLILLFHFVGFAALFGGAFVQLRGPKRVINPAMWHGALTMLVTGLLLVMSLELFSDRDINHMKIGIKLVVMIAVFVLVLINRKKDKLSDGMYYGIAGLTLLNAIVAVFV